MTSRRRGTRRSPARRRPSTTRRCTRPSSSSSAGWTDGLFFVGQRPGRASRLRKLPTLPGKRALCYVTYALDPGKTLDKLVAIVEGLGATVEGGMTIRRDKLAEGAREFVDRALANVVST